MSDTQDLFYEALKLPESEWKAFLDRHCNDPARREKVLQLLRSYSSSFLESPPPTIRASDGSRSTPEGTDRIGPYKILERLGEGGMGEVYLAEQTEPVHRRVALKLIKWGFDSDEIVSRFESERQALALMSHPNIARVFDAGRTDSGRPYFVMEYVPGLPLTEHCDRYELGLRERLILFLDVCRAVQHAHQKSVIHRDLKPSNVLVTFQDDKAVPRLIDFGVAKATNRSLCEHTLYTEQGRMIGTPEYMSPEQADLTSQDIDTRSDIYSLGVLLYETLVGILPFDWGRLRKEGYTRIREVLRTDDPPRPSTRLNNHPQRAAIAKSRRTNPQSLVKELRRDLDWIVLKALDRDRTKRYASASELERDIEHYLECRPIVARPPTVRYRLRTFSRRNRKAVYAGVGVALLVGLSVTVFLVSSFLELAALRRDASRAIERGDLSTARAKALLLAERAPGDRRTLEIRKRIEELERRIDRDRSAELRSEAEAMLARYRRLIDLHERWLEQRDRGESWKPVWEREDELTTWRRFQDLLEQIGPVEDFTSRALVTLYQALDVAPSDSGERTLVTRAVAAVHAARYSDEGLRLHLSLRSGFLKRVIESRSRDPEDPVMGESRRISFSTRPAGADVFCFRYEERAGRLLPVPFRPADDSPETPRRERPPLRIEKNWGKRAPFEDGDRIRQVNGQDVRSHADLAAVLRTVGENEPVRVIIMRQGEEKTVEWIPFPAPESGSGHFRPGRMVDPYIQFGLTFAAYPLEVEPAFSIGRTSSEAAVEIELPPGSYLLLFRKDGYEDLRLPLRSLLEENPRTITLLKTGEIPPGFVYIPEGVVRTGGDAQAFQPEDPGTHRVKGFFIGRHEVTLEEWLEFLNDPEVIARTNDEGKALPALDDVKRELEEITGADRVALLDLEDPAWKRDAETGVWSYYPRPRMPAVDISHFAAREYAHWRTRKARRDGKRWRFRLPTDREWERAARGVDRRLFVWGDYRVWSYCLSKPGSWHGKLLDVGTNPFDESVFGIRDMAGSQHEHTTGAPVEDDPHYRSYRGGSWRSQDEQFFHIASRNTMYPQESKISFGVRLVAELGK